MKLSLLNRYILFFGSIVVNLIFSQSSSAQLKFLVPKTEADSNYIYSFKDRLNARLFTVNKFNNFTLFGNANNNHQAIRFSSNRPTGIGIGAVYKIYNINISMSLPKIKDFSMDYDKTRAIDLHTSMYGRKWVFDLYGQFYKGFFTNNLSSPYLNSYGERTDIIMNSIGATAHYLLNSNKFSYRAFRINDEWQYKSSGTFMFSLSTFLGQIYSNTGDGLISDEYYVNDRNADVNNKSYFQIGPGGGYAHNFVFRKNFFFLTTGSIRALLDYNVEKTVGESTFKNLGVNWGYTLTSAIGYQNNKWGVNASIINTFNTLGTHVYGQSYHTNVGYVKLTGIYRIPNGKFVKTISKPLDYLLRK